MKQCLLFAALILCAQSLFSQEIPAKKKALSLAALKEATSIKAVLPDFDFDAVCTVESYVVLVIPRRDDPVQYNVVGSDFPNIVKQRFKTLEAGTMVNIMNIKSRCPLDVAARDIGSLNFLVK
jgi:hypothetical protein